MSLHPNQGGRSKTTGHCIAGRNLKSTPLCLMSAMPRSAAESETDMSRLFANALTTVLWTLFSVAVQGQTADGAETSQLHSLFEEYWENVLREAPTYATFLGDHRYDDRLEDLSADGTRRRRVHRMDLVHRLEAIDPATLKDGDRVSRSVLLYALRSEIRGD